MFSSLRRTYNKVLKLADHPHAIWWLAIISFTESSFFPIPPDVLLLPLCMARREQALRIAGVCTIASVLGGLFGYALGYFAFDTVGQPIFQAYGIMDKYESFRGMYDNYGNMIVFIAGFSPIPYKVITITAGVAQFNLLFFILLSALSRGLRFGILAILIKLFGETAMSFIDKHFEKLTVIGAILLIGGFVAFKYLA